MAQHCVQRQDTDLCLLALPVTSELGPAPVLSLWSTAWSTFREKKELANVSTCEKVTLGEIQSEMPSWEAGVEPH